MSSKKQYAIMLKMAEKEEFKAAQLFDQQRQNYLAHKAQVEKIENYLADYHRQITDHSSVNLHLIESQRNYLSQLANLLKTQQESLSIMHQQLEKARCHWQQKHLRRIKIQETSERIILQESMIIEKKQQQSVDDEFSQRRFGSYASRISD